MTLCATYMWSSFSDQSTQPTFKMVHGGWESNWYFLIFALTPTCFCYKKKKRKRKSILASTPRSSRQTFPCRKEELDESVYYSVGARVLSTSAGPSRALCCRNLMVQLLRLPFPAKVEWAEKLLLITSPVFLSLPGRDSLQLH